MRRRFIALPLLAVLALAGCAAAEARTTAAACESVTSSWDEFEAFAQTPGRDDAEMLAKRSAMLSAWEEATDGAPSWTETNVGVALDSMKAFSAGPSTTDEATSLYSATASQIEALRAQCVADANL